MPVMLDLFAGRGGASRAMRERGWTVVTVDMDPRFDCTHTSDVTLFSWAGGPVDLLWASPPCTEFSRESMPWCKTGRRPSVDCVLATLRLVHEVQPTWWVLENVRGAQPWIGRLLGPSRLRTGPVYLWGQLPPVLLSVVRPWKEKTTGKRPDLRAELPYELSYQIAVAVERSARPATPAKGAEE